MFNSQIRALLLILLTFASSAIAQRAQILVIDTKNDWSTGVLGEGPISVSTGNEIWIFARGYALLDNSTVPNAGLSPLLEWFTGGPGGLHLHSGAPGGIPVPNSPWNSLVGRIGNTGQAFYVGTGIQMVAQEDGDLYFRINDTFLGDNAGFIVILVYIGSSPTAITIDNNALPETSELMQNYPNPFNPLTKIKYSIETTTTVKMNIYDVSGRLVRNLIETKQSPGNYQVEWYGTDNAGLRVASGQYFYQLEVGGEVKTKKMLLIK